MKPAKLKERKGKCSGLIKIRSSILIPKMTSTEAMFLIFCHFILPYSKYITKAMKGNSGLKFPSSLDLGTALPGHYAECVLPLSSTEIAFLTLKLSAKTLSNGFFLVNEGSSECSESLNLVLKPGKNTSISVGCYYPREVT